METLFGFLQDFASASGKYRRSLIVAWRERARRTGVYEEDDGNFSGWMPEDFELVIDASEIVSDLPYDKRTPEQMRIELRTLALRRGYADALPSPPPPEAPEVRRRLRDVVRRLLGR